MSPRPPPKISLKHDWKREFGSEDAQRSEGQVVQQFKSFQSNQPIPNPDHDRTGQPVVRTDRTGQPVVGTDTRTAQDGSKTSRSQRLRGPTIVVATDADGEGGIGACIGAVVGEHGQGSVTLWSRLYALSEEKGEYVRLDWAEAGSEVGGAAEDATTLISHRVSWIAERWSRRLPCRQSGKCNCGFLHGPSGTSRPTSTTC